MEHANFRAALLWLETADHADALFLKLATRLAYFWYLAGYEPEGLNWLRRALAGASDETPPEYIEAVIRTGHLAQTLGDPTARGYLERGRILAQTAGDIGQEAHATIMLGLLAEDIGNFEEAENSMLKGRQLAQQARLEWVDSCALYHLGIIAYGRGDLESARARLEEARTSAQALDDVLIPFWSLPYLALVACEQNDLVRAVELLHQALLAGRNSGLRQGDTVLLGAFAVIAAAIGEWPSTARLLGAAAARNHDNPFALPERIVFAEAETSAHQELSPEHFTEAWESGRMMRLDTLMGEMEQVLLLAERSRSTRDFDQKPSLLTVRERDVLRLMIEGRSNREIAEILFISPRTSTTHVTHILTKFGVENRAAAVTYAFQHDLV